MGNYKNGKVLGIAENDLRGIHPIYSIVDGKMIFCPYYSRWLSVVRREHSKNFREKNPSYATATVDTKWLKFSNFKSWMEKQKWEGLQLDKDILVPGNFHYSPETCVFIPQRINKLLNTNNNRRGEYPLGVKYEKKTAWMVNERSNPYQANVCSYEEEKRYQRCIGMYKTPLEAHRAWQWAKAEEIEKAVAWYATQDCFRTDVADALLGRAWRLRIQHSNFIETTEIM